MLQRRDFPLIVVVFGKNSAFCLFSHHQPNLEYLIRDLVRQLAAAILHELGDALSPPLCSSKSTCILTYSDEGITGLNTKRRSGFNQMLTDALDGKIKLIITKSVSRFARNMVDSLSAIRKLKEAGCEVYFEKEGIWSFDGKGELLLTIMSSLAQKKFTVDFLSKKTKVNEGEVPQYYVEGSHPAIIAPELFDAVQVELKRRKAPGRRNYTPHCFSGYIYCDECGALYGSKVWNAGTPYKATVWQCNAKHRGNTACHTPALRSEEIQRSFIQVVNQIIGNKAEIIHTCEAVLDECYDVEGLVAEYATLQAELEVVTSLMQRHISANAHSALDQADYQRQYGEYAARFGVTRNRINEVGEQREALIAKRGRIQSYLDTLKPQELITEFDEVLWYGMVDQVLVVKDGKLRFIFNDGVVIED